MTKVNWGTYEIIGIGLVNSCDFIIKSFECGHCGGPVESNYGPGRTMELVIDGPKLSVPNDFDIPKCNVCGESFMDGDTEKEIVLNIRERSGSVNIKGRLVGFLYDLMRDHVPPGIIEETLLQSCEMSDEEDCLYSNGWLANYAKDVAERLMSTK